jgi:urocanate hydratase
MRDLATTDPVLFAELAATYDLYAALARDLDAEAGLGGKLLYAGELNLQGSQLMRAANVAGAASLGATADTAMQRAAIREGVADFLVTSLDEALRILKNEIRKRQTVAVCVAAAPEAMAAEMRERGVLPDFLGPIAAQPLRPNQIFLAVADAPAGFEARALALIPESGRDVHRWLLLSSRYLGPKARRVRSLTCTKEIAAILTTDH